MIDQRQVAREIRFIEIRCPLRQSSFGRLAIRSRFIAPVSKPDAIGEKTITPIPFALAVRKNLGLDFAMQQ